MKKPSFEEELAHAISRVTNDLPKGAVVVCPFLEKIGQDPLAKNFKIACSHSSVGFMPQWSFKTHPSPVALWVAWAAWAGEMDIRLTLATHRREGSLTRVTSEDVTGPPDSMFPIYEEMRDRLLAAKWSDWDLRLHTMMAETKFWNIIDSSRKAARKLKRKPGEDFIDLHERTLAEALRQLSPAEIVAYEERFDELHGKAYRWDLWAVAYWMHGGCGDDGFIDFRACLISLGKERFNKALKNPDSLAEIIGLPDTPYMQAEGFQYIGHRVYEELTGEEDFPDYENHHPQEPAGERIDHDDVDVMREHFPKLIAKMPEMGD